MLEFERITGKIILESGLHIGAGDTEMRIGGTDNPVIKHPHSNAPYIPGSSLKGKVRSLLEMRSGLMGMSNGAPLSLKEYKKLGEGNSGREACRKILMLFGAGGSDKKEMEKEVVEIGPGRVSFADCRLDEQWQRNAEENNWPLIEVKSENSINRIKGTAENPRFTERVVANAEFTFALTLKKLSSEENLKEFLFEGLSLLQMDALGGSGSRGYGRIRFEFDKEANKKLFKQKYEELLE